MGGPPDRGEGSASGLQGHGRSMVTRGQADGFGDDRQRVLDATDIVRLISDHVQLKPKGREYVGLCPFHDDHSPSMFVVPHKQIYHCFSCGAGGNALGFVMNYHKMGFREALEHLAERGGITLAPRKLFRQGAGGAFAAEGGDDEPATSRAALLRASATAQTFFRAILAHPEHGRAARETVERRGISPEMVELFGLGAAPDKWDGLALTIAGKGLPAEPFRTLGLLKARENSPGVYDAFRNRLMFPIHDQIGRVIGFGGRRLNDEDEPKYINSAESPLFDKSTTLYGLHQATQAIRQTRVAIVTEGYMDTIACHQAGVRSAVATLGTALTPGNARVLRRLCDTVVLLFDGDEAGQKAAERAVEVFFAEPVDVKIAMLSGVTDAKDPDELLKREGGRALFDRAVAEAIDPLELLFARVKRQIGGAGLSARGRAIEEFVGRMVDLGLERVDKLRYQLIVKRLAEIAGVDWETITTAVAARRGRGARPRMGAPAGAPLVEARPLTTGEALLGCILNDPALPLSLGEDEWSAIDPDGFEDEGSAAVARAVADLIVAEGEPSLAGVLTSTDDERVQRAATRLSREVERLTESDPERLKRLWRESLALARAEKTRAEVRQTVEEGAGETEGAETTMQRIERLRSLKTGIGNDTRIAPRPAS